MELLTQLGIDWKVLVAQIINFLILLAVLAKFVYKPVLSTLEKRSKTIEKGLHDAQESSRRLAEVEVIEKDKLSQAHKEVGRLIEAARADAEKVKNELVAAAQKQCEEMLAKARVQMEQEKDAMLAAASNELSALIIKATTKLIDREINADDQKRLTQALASEMKV